jgi:hypothetical protein
MAWDEAERPCRKCKTPTHWRTQRGAAIHPMCEPPWPRLTPQAEREVLVGLLAAFPRSTVTRPPTPQPAGAARQLAPIHVRNGPCSWCGRPGVGITDDEFLHCVTHLWPPYRWPPPSQGGTQ